MGGEFVAIFVVGIVTLGTYRLFELFVRRKERMALIEKISFNPDSKFSADQLYLPLFKQKKGTVTSWVLNISLLMIGVGLGLIIAFFIVNGIAGDTLVAYDYNWDMQRNINNYVEIIYFASVSIFGGLGLLASYFIEQKNRNKNREQDQK